LYITLYTRRRPIAIAIVEVMPRARVMYSNTNKHSYSTLRQNKYQTDINTFIMHDSYNILTNVFSIL